MALHLRVTAARRRSLRYSPICAAAVVLIVLAGGASAAKAEAQPSVEILPSAIELGAGDGGEARVIIANPTDTPVVVNDFDVIPAPGIVSELTGLRRGTVLAPASSAVATLKIGALPGHTQADLTVIVDVSNGAAPPKPLSDSITVKAADGKSQLLTASFSGEPAQLNDGQCQPAVLIIANKSTSTLTAIEVDPVHSADVALTVGGLLPGSNPASVCATREGHRASTLPNLDPGDTMQIAVGFRANSEVTAGVQEVLTEVSAKPILQIAGDIPRGQTLVETKVELRVFGVDSLSPFGLGVLFVVPGLLAVVAFTALIRAVYPRRTTAPDTVSLTNFNLMPWIILGASAAYLLVWFIWGFNLTQRAGTGSVALLLGIGLGIGVIAWAVAAISYFVAHGRKLVKIDDDELALLHRMQLRHAPLELPSHQSATNVLYLVVAPESKSSSFAAPQIRYSIRGDDSMASHVEMKFQKAIDENDYKTLISIVRQGDVQLEWSDAGGIRVFADSDLSTKSKASLLEQAVSRTAAEVARKKG